MVAKHAEEPEKRREGGKGGRWPERGRAAANPSASRGGTVPATARPARRASGTPAASRRGAGEGVAPERLDGRRRVVIEGVEPEIDGGRFPIKRTVGERVRVEADVFADGHDAIACVLRWRAEADDGWREARMEPLGNDRWAGEFRVARLGRYRYTLAGWVDPFETWRRDLRKRAEAGQDLDVPLRIGAELVEEAARRAPRRGGGRLLEWVPILRGENGASRQRRLDRALDEELSGLMEEAADRGRQTEYGRELEVVVDRERARFSAWYEMFPRSCGDGGSHGTFRDCEARLPYVAAMGFDVLYLPPIHPIGRTARKGKDNRPVAAPEDIGSPWAIGSHEGGHKAIHPRLGTLEDFRRFRERAEANGLELALDIAFQCSPDHPYVRERPEWFRRRPDGSIQYAENPPKKYEDIVPFDFESDAWPALWAELKSVFLYWIGEGVKIFRVDNPHTKPFPFWEWCIGEIKRDHPETIFLSEAFTRPKVMVRLAKLGFTQSYTYFAWRNSRRELTDYFTELTRTEAREYFRPNLWPNTPDILTEYLQTGGRPASAVRLVLAATLGASYGVYGPPFELAVTVPREPGSEEYLGSEKYQVRRWDLGGEGSLKDLIARVNRIRREHPALQSDRGLRFHRTDNEELIAYSKRDESGENVILVCANLDPHHRQSGWVELELEPLGLTPEEAFQVHDLLGDARYLWQGPRNYVELDPSAQPAHVFRIGRRARSERDFDYYM